MITLERFGRATANPPLVIVPGIDGSIGSVEPIVEKMATQRQVIVINYTRETEATLDRLSDVIENALYDQHYGTFDLLGQSIGTIIAAQLSVRSLPVRRVVLISTFLRLNDLKLKLSNFFTSLSPRWLYRLISRPVLSWQCGPVGDGQNHPFFALSANSDPSLIVKRTKWEIGRSFHNDIASVTAPLLLLMGEQDRFVPNAQREIEELKRLAARSNAHVVTVPNAGHVLLSAAAIDFAVLQIKEFLT